MIWQRYIQRRSYSFRTGKCSNQTGHLGFTCLTDYEKSSWVVGHTQIDPDGNHLNNTQRIVKNFVIYVTKKKVKEMVISKNNTNTNIN